MTTELLVRLALTSGCSIVLLVVSVTVLLHLQHRKKQYNERIYSVIARPVAAKPASTFDVALNVVPIHSRAIVKLLTKSPFRNSKELFFLWALLLVGFVIALVITLYLCGFLGYSALPIVVVLPVALTRNVFEWRDARLENAYRRQFPEALAIVARTVRVGVPVSEALKIVAVESEDPTASEFAYLVDRIAMGVPLAEALHKTAERTGLAEHQLFAIAVSLQSRTGGGLSETLINLAVTIRRRISARQRARAMASEAQTTAYILGGLPLVTGGLLGLVNPSYVAILFTDRGGNIILMVAAGFLMSGFFVMRTIIRKSLA